MATLSELQGLIGERVVVGVASSDTPGVVGVTVIGKLARGAGTDLFAQMSGGVVTGGETFVFEIHDEGEHQIGSFVIWRERFERAKRLQKEAAGIEIHAAGLAITVVRHGDLPPSPKRD